jgi:hypothetical protein
MKKRYLVAITAGLMALTASWAAQAQYDYDWQGGYVKPCSLDGVNPSDHPGIFGNPAVARSYGFLRAPNGTWHVAPGCQARDQRR